MKQGLYTIAENAPVCANVFRMRLEGDVSAITRPGQFVNIRLEGRFLRRPISVYDWDDSSFTIIYKILGGGTEQMSSFSPGKELDILTGLGNGFSADGAGEAPLLLGGGVGTPPLYALAKELISRGLSVTAVLGFNTREDVFGEKEFSELGVRTIIATADGSCGVRGFVTDAMEGLEYSSFFACGPEPMLRAVFRTSKTSGQLSFEERMGCGFGACMGCTCKTITGYKRICRDGPVLRKEEIAWDD